MEESQFGAIKLGYKHAELVGRLASSRNTYWTILYARHIED